MSNNKAAKDKRRAVRDQSAKKAPSADKVSTRRTSRTKPDAQNMADESNESSSDNDSEELSERLAQSVPVDAQNKRARKSQEVVNGRQLASLSNKQVVRTRSVSNNKAAKDKRRAVRDQSAKNAPSADKVSTRRTSRTKPDAQNMADESNESSSDSDSEELSERSAQGATKSQPLLRIPT